MLNGVKNSLNKNLLTLADIKLVVGVDISYFIHNNKEFGVSCAVLWNLSTNKMEYGTFAKDKIKFPYKPGFLGFRECKLLAKAIYKLPRRPDVIMCDGHGIIHPRRFGEAVQLGMAIDIPSIGIAKNPFIGYSDWTTMKRKRGNKIPIWAYDPNLITDSKQELLGYAICLNNNLKPVFISPGYKTTLNLTTEIVLKTTKEHRQPEPLFLADFLSRREIDDFS